MKKASDDEGELVGRAWERYDEELRRTRALDFDDLLDHTVRLLKKRSGPRDLYRERFRYLLVDEYQDTNGIQYEVVRALAGGP
ncbi:MAG: UvrD-helicase domain-containing protein, partial [Myxococcota bacterium]